MVVFIFLELTSVLTTSKAARILWRPNLYAAENSASVPMTAGVIAFPLQEAATVPTPAALSRMVVTMAIKIDCQSKQSRIRCDLDALFMTNAIAVVLVFSVICYLLRKPGAWAAVRSSHT
jgi:hypothetical protein